MKTRLTEGAWARWGLLISAFLLGAILIVASWSNYQSARDATTALHIGQARILEREIMGTIRPGEEAPELEEMVAALDSLLSVQAEQGLRYIALLDAGGKVALSIGEPVSAPPQIPPEVKMGRGFTLERVGSRVRMSLVRPRPGFPAPDDDRSESGPAGGDRQGDDRRDKERTDVDRERLRRARHSGIIFEFEPVIASHVMDQASRLLAFGVAAAVVMMLVAAVSWGVSLRYERARLQLEHERRLSLLGQMSAVLAHEIRNPLASLKGHAQLLTERLEPSSPDRQKADRIVMEASRLEALTSDLLDFVRSGPLDSRPVDPRELLRTCAEEVSAGGFALEIEHAPATWTLDAVRVHRVLTNLLRNADQASPEKGERPVVAMGVEGGRLVVTIRDHGEGLLKGEEERIFEPFFTTRASGTGLGLAVARRIVELHGGTLAATNHPAGGALFRLTIPAERA